MVETGHLQVAVEDLLAMGVEAGVEQRHVAGIGEHRALQVVIVRDRPGRAQPDVLLGGQLLVRQVVLEAGMAQLDGSVALPVALDAVGDGVAHPLHRGRDLLFAGQLVRRRDVGCGLVPVQAALVALKARRHGPDGVAVLDADDAPRGERAAVADTIDLVDDRHLRIARPQEVAVQRMDLAVLRHRALRGDEGLADHLTAEHALPGRVGAATAEQVVLQRFQVEGLEKSFGGV